MSKKNTHKTIATLLLTLLLSGFPIAAAERDSLLPETEPPLRLTVGIYDNSPKIFRDADGIPRGIFIDLLEYTAEQENWELSYHYGSFAELLQALEAGEIDILPDTAYSGDRDSRFAFSTINIIDDWLQVFTRANSEIRVIQDLQGASIAVLEGSRQEAFLQDEFRELHDIAYSLQSFPSYAATQRAVLAGSADAMAASRFFAFAPTRDPRVVATGILFSPSINLYAFPSDIPAEIPSALDYHIARLQNQSQSLYYQSLQHWLDPAQADMPGQLIWALAVSGALVFILLSLVPLLRRQVKHSHSQLATATTRLHESERNYQEIFNAGSDAIFIIHPESGRIMDVNTTALEMYRIADTAKLPEITDLSSTVHGYTLDVALHHVHTAARTGFNQFEWLARRLDGSTFWTEISLKSAVIGGEARILGLVHDITQRKQAEKRLQQSLQDKEILLKELYHRTKNNMQIISGLLNLQSNDFEDPRLIQAFIEAENRIHAMSLVHEKLYTSQNLASITADEYLQDLVNQIVHSYASMAAGIQPRIQAQSVALSVECAVPLGLAINELLSNSIKYAFPVARGDAEVRLQLRQLNEPGDSVELVYCDNGIGVPDIQALEHTSSLGIHLIKSIFRDQLGGTAEFSNRGGLCCTARFSLSLQRLPQGSPREHTPADRLADTPAPGTRPPG